MHSIGRRDQPAAIREHHRIRGEGDAAQRERETKSETNGCWLHQMHFSLEKLISDELRKVESTDSKVKQFKVDDCLSLSLFTFSAPFVSSSLV